MRAKRKTVNTENTENTQSATSIRASISFPSEVYETLEIIAKEKKVSLAWVVREATEKYRGQVAFAGGAPNARA
jgi:predicted DNA-binding ribbon-helix-helix protein